MNTNEIFGFLHLLFKNKKCQYNVIPCNALDKIKIRRYPLYLVINSKPKGHPGEHWLAIYIQNVKSQINFFCSYGLTIRMYSDNFKKFATRLGRRRIYQNTKQIQAFNSIVCGQHCIHYLWKCSQNRSMLSVYCNFSSNFKRNDEIVKTFVNSKNHLFHECKHKNISNIQCCTKFQ